jgi:hypothetical protein
MATWTLKIGELTRTFAGWGIDADSVQLVFRSFESDTLSWAMTEADALAEPPFAYDQPVTLYKDGVKWFVGRIHDDPVEFAAKGEVQRYICKNAWADLETCIWEQARTETLDQSNPITLFMSRQLLTFRAGVGKIDTKSQLEDVLDFAIADGIQIAYIVDFEGLVPQYQEVRDATVAAIARMMGKWTPDIASHFDYTTEPYPTVIFKRRGNPITPVTLDLSAYVPATGLVGARPIRALRELFVDGVKINYLGTESAPTEGGSPYTTLFSSSAGTIFARPKVLKFTVDLFGRGTANQETPTADFVAAFYAILQKLFYQAVLTFRHLDVPGTYRPGMIINFTGGRAEWTTAKAIVQAVTETPAIGETIVECGAPPFLNKGSFNELARIAAGVDTYGVLSPATVPSSGIAESVECSLACESKSGSASLCGLEEFNDGNPASVPAKRYRKKVKTGQINYTCNGIPHITDYVNTDVYDAATCVQSGTPSVPINGSFNAATSIVVTKTSFRFDVNFVGMGGGAGCAGGQAMTETSWAESVLSEEDTDSDAENRAMAAITDWTTAPADCTSHTSYRTQRTGSEIGFSFRKGRSRVSFNASSEATYRVRTYFRRRVYGSGSTFAAYVVNETDISAGVGPVVMPYVDTPSEDGYEILAAGATVYRLPPSP